MLSCSWFKLKGEEMAEKRRSGVGTLMPESKFSKAESDREFLSQAGVGVLLRDALLKLVEARSEDPIGFLAEHFTNLASESEAGGGGDEEQQENTVGEQQQLSRALWHLSLAHHSQRYRHLTHIPHGQMYWDGRPLYQQGLE